MGFSNLTGEKAMSSSSQSLRIVVLIENNPYHVDRCVRPQVEALMEAGHQMTVISPHDRGEPWRGSVNGVRVYRFPAYTGGFPILSYFFEFFLATFFMTMLTSWIWVRHGLDVVHFYNPPDSLFVAALLPKLAGKTVVFHMRELSAELYTAKYQHTNRILSWILTWLERRACRLADHIIVVNETCRQIVSERNKVPLERVSVVRVASHQDKVRLTAPDPELRARAKTIIAFLGSMAAQDGVDQLLRALHQLDQRFGYKDWQCMLVGPAADLNALKELTAKLGIDDRVQFTGYLPDELWIPILSTADICVEPCPANPLTLASSMIKILDYMALEKPMVAYDLPEHRVTAGDAILYAQRNDDVDLARQILRLAEDPDLRQRLGAIGHKRLSEQQLTWDHQRKRLLSLYEHLA
jgi:glycosyltransferase involved in cell wall biosynthesis